MDKPEQHMAPPGKMKVEIWSDVLCPFCYIGKREFENALARFPAREHVEVEWKSFQLDPSAPERAEGDMFDMLARERGGTREQAKAMVGGVVERARSLGLDYRMEQAVMVNSYDAHRLIQLAKSRGLGDAMEERLFKGYFTEGADLSDHATLQRLGEKVGLPAQDVAALWAGDAFGDAVRADGSEGRRIGLRGVPFFVIVGKYAVSGAQADAHFLGALQQAWGERPAPLIEVSGADGPRAIPKGNVTEAVPLPDMPQQVNFLNRAGPERLPALLPFGDQPGDLAMHVVEEARQLLKVAVELGRGSRPLGQHLLARFGHGAQALEPFQHVRAPGGEPDAEIAPVLAGVRHVLHFAQCHQLVEGTARGALAQLQQGSDVVEGKLHHGRDHQQGHHPGKRAGGPVLLAQHAEALDQFLLGLGEFWGAVRHGGPGAKLAGGPLVLQVQN